jgi:hypothetical protein
VRQLQAAGIVKKMCNKSRLLQRRAEAIFLSLI